MRATQNRAGLAVEQAFVLGRVLTERVAPGVSSSESRGGEAA